MCVVIGCVDCEVDVRSLVFQSEFEFGFEYARKKTSQESEARSRSRKSRSMESPGQLRHRQDSLGCPAFQVQVQGPVRFRCRYTVNYK